MSAITFIVIRGRAYAGARIQETSLTRRVAREGVDVDGLELAFPRRRLARVLQRAQRRRHLARGIDITITIDSSQSLSRHRRAVAVSPHRRGSTSRLRTMNRHFFRQTAHRALQTRARRGETLVRWRCLCFHAHLVARGGSGAPQRGVMTRSTRCLVGRCEIHKLPRAPRVSRRCVR